MNEESLDQALDITKTVAGTLGQLLLEMLPRSLLLGLLGFVLAVVLVVVGNRKAWFSREHRVWNILSKLHYLLWIPLATFTGCAMGATSALESRVEAELDERFQPLLEAEMPALETFLVEKLPVRSDDESISVGEATQRFLQTLYYEPESDGLFDKTKARCVNWVTLNFGKWVIVTTFGAIVAYAVGRTGETLGLDASTIEFTVNTIKTADLSQVDKNIAQIVVEAVQHQVSAFFNGIYVQILGIFALILLACIIEIVIYHLWWKKRYVKVQATGAEP